MIKMFKKILLPIIVILLLLCISQVSALYNASIVYGTFNNTTMTHYTVPDTNVVKVSWQAKIYCKLTFNTTAVGSWAMLSLENAITGTITSVDLKFYKNNALDIVYNDGTSASKLASAKWNSTKPIYVIMNKGKMTVKNSTTTWIKDFALTEWNFKYYGAKGESTKLVTDGYVQLEVDTYSLGLVSGVYEIFMAWLPVIVYLAVFGAIMGMLGKMMGKIGR